MTTERKTQLDQLTSRMGDRASTLECDGITFTSDLLREAADAIDNLVADLETAEAKLARVEALAAEWRTSPDEWHYGHAVRAALAEPKDDKA